MINPSLLIHSVKIKTKAGTDFYGESTYTEKTIDKVRVGKTYGVYISGVGYQSSDSLTLFIDMHNSTGDKTVNLNDIVVFNEKEFEIRKITECFTQNTSDVHHLKVELV